MAGHGFHRDVGRAFAVVTFAWVMALSGCGGVAEEKGPAEGQKKMHSIHTNMREVNWGA
jgi:hypothetical protein